MVEITLEALFWHTNGWIGRLMMRDDKLLGRHFVQKKTSFARFFLSTILFLLPLNILASSQTPLSYFAIFYQNLLEFSTCATMNIKGLVHCNTNIYVGAGGSATLTFANTVTAVGTISAPANNGFAWDNPTTNINNAWRTVFNGSPSNLTGLPPLQLSIPMTNAHCLIDIPATNDPTTLAGQQLLYNQAQVVLIISNVAPLNSNIVVTLKVQKAPTPLDVPGADIMPVVVTYTNPTPSSLSNTLPFLCVTNRFYDLRERTTNITTQIDIGKYKLWLTNSLGPVVEKYPAFGADSYPTILFVSDSRNTNALHQLTVVRLTNGMAPPVNGGLGFSIATPNPLYVFGNYNCTNPGFLGTTNTSSAVPSALFCDALTILSPAWSDYQSFHNGFSSGNENASDTTINAAIVAGVVPSTGSDNLHFSGGVHNFPRLLEDWSGNALTLNGALINLYTSARATGQFLNPGTYYNPPTRQYNHDPKFNNPAIAPPGMPTISMGSPLVFVQPQVGVAFAGNSGSLSFRAAGYGTLTYQWSLNATNIDGATNTSFALTNIQSKDAGTYTVTVADGFSTNTSLVADFTVVDIKPFILQPPPNQAVLVGSNVTFTATATGTTPMNWQWQFNQTNIDDATNATLVLTSVTADQAGIYSVTVTNVIGSTTSSNAVLSVYSSPAPTMDSFSFSAGNQIQFTINGVPGLNYVVQASTNLSDWDSIITNISPFNFTDTKVANMPQRYYRAVYLP